MYLHLGGDVLLHDEEIIGIFDLDITSQSFRTRRYLNRAEKAGDVVYVDIEEIPKSFTVTAPVNAQAGERNDSQRVFISPLASQTLQRRLQHSEFGIRGLECEEF